MFKKIEKEESIHPSPELLQSPPKWSSYSHILLYSLCSPVAYAPL